MYACGRRPTLEYAAGGAGWQNLGNGYYQDNWTTPKDYAGSCKTILLGLSDARQDLRRTALFQFNEVDRWSKVVDCGAVGI